MGMIMMCALLLCSSMLFVNVESAALDTAGNDFFQSIDPERRNLLVKHFLTEALLRYGIHVNPDPRVANAAEEFGIPPQNFGNDLLSWTRTKTGLTYVAIAGRVGEDQVNTDTTACNPADVGCHCCPF